MIKGVQKVMNKEIVKKKYEAPTLKITELATEDIIMTSTLIALPTGDSFLGIKEIQID